MKPTPGYSTLAITQENDHSTRLDLVEKSTHTSVEFGRSVSLLSSAYKVVGTGLIMDGTTLHGHAVPKVAKVATGGKPWPSLKDDNEDLSGGSITAWPLKFI